MLIYNIYTAGCQALQSSLHLYCTFFRICHILLHFSSNVHEGNKKSLFGRYLEEKKYVLCKIWGFHGDDYEEYRLLGYSTVWLCFEPTFRRNVSPSSSGQVNNTRSQVSRWLRSLDGDDTFLRNVGSNQSHTVLHPRRRYSSLMIFEHVDVGECVSGWDHTFQS
jgi:hypothetical protein